MANIFHIDRPTNKIILGTADTIINVMSDLTMSDGKTIGQSTGPLLTFDDTNNFLEITGCKVGIGTTTPNVIASWTAPVGDTILNIYEGTNLSRITAQGNLGAALDLIDLSGAENDKWISLRVGAGRARFRCITDDGSLSIEDIISLDLGTGKVGIGLAMPKTKLTIEGALTLKEQAAAEGDTAAYGQIWVKNDAPNILMFTDDAGTDHQIAFV